MNEDQQRVIINPNEVGLQGFLAKMYGFMAGAIAISAVIAYLISNVFYTQTINFIAQNQLIVWILFGLQFAIVLGMSFKADRSPVMTAFGLLSYAVIEGLFFGVIVSAYAKLDVTMAFVGAAAVFCYDGSDWNNNQKGSFKNWYASFGSFDCISDCFTN